MRAHWNALLLVQCIMFVLDVYSRNVCRAMIRIQKLHKRDTHPSTLLRCSAANMYLFSNLDENKVKQCFTEICALHMFHLVQCLVISWATQKSNDYKVQSIMCTKYLFCFHKPSVIFSFHSTIFSKVKCSAKLSNPPIPLSLRAGDA